MHIANTYLDGAGAAHVSVWKPRGSIDVAAWLTLEIGCRHEGGDGFCLIDPPSWMWNIGLGRVVWHLGQWAEFRLADAPTVWEHRVDRSELEAFGWPLAEEDDAS